LALPGEKKGVDGSTTERVGNDYFQRKNLLKRAQLFFYNKKKGSGMTHISLGYSCYAHLAGVFINV
jgi:hypothetical protein